MTNTAEGPRLGFFSMQPGVGPWHGSVLRGEIGFTPKATAIYAGEQKLDTVSEISLDILNRVATLRERFVLTKEEYKRMMQLGWNVRTLGEFVNRSDGQIMIVAERTTSGRLLSADFRAEGLRIGLGEGENAFSFVIFNYEPVTNLTKLVLEASALKPGTGWLTIDMGVYPILE